MSKDGILYERPLPHGPVVRVRRTSPEGVTPVVAVVEVDRRAGTPREGIGTPPPLLQTEANTEKEALARLKPEAEDDRVIVQLMREKGLR